jgi:hypothetical protein
LSELESSFVDQDARLVGFIRTLEARTVSPITVKDRALVEPIVPTKMIRLKNDSSPKLNSSRRKSANPEFECDRESGMSVTMRGPTGGCVLRAPPEAGLEFTVVVSMLNERNNFGRFLNKP